MNVPESDARASSFFFLAPDCWCRFTGIVVHQLWSFAFSRNHKVRADAGMAHHILLFIYLFMYLFIYLFFEQLGWCPSGSRCPTQTAYSAYRERRYWPYVHPESLQILQIHSFFSSVHLTHFLQGSGQRPGMDMAKASFCAQWCIFMLILFWIIVLREDPNMVHYKISNRGSQVLIFYLLVFDWIHDAMHLNKTSRTSSRNIGPQHYRSSSIFKRGHGVLFIPVCIKPIWWVCWQKAIFLCFIWQ